MDDNVDLQVGSLADFNNAVVDTSISNLTTDITVAIGFPALHSGSY